MVSAPVLDADVVLGVEIDYVLLDRAQARRTWVVNPTVGTLRLGIEPGVTPLEVQRCEVRAYAAALQLHRGMTAADTARLLRVSTDVARNARDAALAATATTETRTA